MTIGPFNHLELIAELNQDYNVPGDINDNTNAPRGARLTDNIEQTYLILADPKIDIMNCLPNSAMANPHLITAEKMTYTEQKKTNVIEIEDKNTGIGQNATREEKFTHYNRTRHHIVNGITGIEFPLPLADTNDCMTTSEKQSYNKLILAMISLDSIDPNKILLRDTITGSFRYPTLSWMDPDENMSGFSATASPEAPFFDAIRIGNYTLEYDGFTKDLNALRNHLPEWRRIHEQIRKSIHESFNLEATLNNLREAILETKFLEIDYHYTHDIPTERIERTGLPTRIIQGTFGLPKNIILELYLNNPDSRPKEDNVDKILGPLHKEYNRILPYLKDKNDSEEVIAYLAKVRDNINDPEDPFLRKLTYSYKLEMYDKLWSELEKESKIYWTPDYKKEAKVKAAFNTILDAKEDIDNNALERYLNTIEFDEDRHTTTNKIGHMILNHLGIENYDRINFYSDLVDIVQKTPKKNPSIISEPKKGPQKPILIGYTSP